MNCDESISCLSGELRPRYTDSDRNELFVAHIPPILYRFIEERYIDEFLDTGRLQISTIPKCRKLENENRRDPTESVYGYVFLDENGSHQLQAKVGENAFVLCASLSQAAYHKKEIKACLELRCIDQLAIEIASQLKLAGFDICEILSGPCIYAQKMRLIDLRGSGESFNSLIMAQDEKGQLNVDNKKVDDILGRLGRGAFYTTKELCFMNEHEYRIMWLCQSAVPDEYVYVTIPNPERYGCKIPAI